MTAPSTEYGCFADPRLSDRDCHLVRDCVPCGTLGYGLFISFETLLPTSAPSWNPGYAARIVFSGNWAQTVAAVGMRIERGTVRPDTPGQLWAVRADVSIRSTAPARVWGIIEGLTNPSFVQSAPFGSLDIFKATPAESGWQPPCVLTIHGTGPNKWAEDQNTGFGSILVRTDSPGAVTVSHAELTVHHLGPRPPGR